MCNLVGMAASPSSWLPLVGRIMIWQAAEPQGCLGLGLAQWWAEPGFGMYGCGARPLVNPRVSFLVGGAKAHRVLGLTGRQSWILASGCRSLGILKMVSA